MKVILTLLGEGDKEYVLTKRTFTIGRAKSNDICISHEGLSRVHCQVEINSQGEIIITDLNSTNGVLIQGQRIVAGVPTTYQSFLSIAIGPIQGLAVSTDEIPLTRNQPPLRETAPRKLPSKGKPLRGENNNGQRPHFSKQIILLIVLLVVLLSALFFGAEYFKPEKDQFELPSAPRNLNL